LGEPETVNGSAEFIGSATVGVLWTAVTSVFGFGVSAAFMITGAMMPARLRPDPKG
jgi:hypothetical protein